MDRARGLWRSGTGRCPTGERSAVPVPHRSVSVAAEGGVGFHQRCHRRLHTQTLVPILRSLALFVTARLFRRPGLKQRFETLRFQIVLGLHGGFLRLEWPYNYTMQMVRASPEYKCGKVLTLRCCRQGIRIRFAGHGAYLQYESRFAERRSAGAASLAVGMMTGALGEDTAAPRTLAAAFTGAFGGAAAAATCGGCGREFADRQ